MPTMDKLVNSNDQKLKSRLRKGIPDGVRMIIWPMIAEVEKMKLIAQVEFNDLVNSKEVSPFEN